MTASSLEECLCLLYNYLSHFQVLIDIVQKLAHQLKLETFVDKQGLELGANNKDDQKTIKLTIAGTTIMIDVDFSGDREVTNVVLLLANQNENTAKPDSQSTDFVERHGANLKIDWSKNELSFLKQVHEDNHTVAESILQRNLIGNRLGNFPENLRYLANLDHLLSVHCDLFIYLERMALILRALESVDTVAEPWLQPFVSAVGKTRLNNVDTDQLGIFIEYWHDCRYINHNGVATGDPHSIKLSISPGNGPQSDYINDATNWNMIDGEFTLEFEPTVSTAAGTWTLAAQFSSPIFIPQSILEYFGWHPKLASRGKKSKVDRMYTSMNEGQLSLTRGDVTYIISHKPHLGKWLPVELVVLTKFSDLSQLVVILRNIHVLNNVLVGSLDASSRPVSTVDRRRSRGSILCEELSEEAKKRLRDSLKLPNDVADEELLSLNAMSDLAAFGMEIDEVDRFLSDGGPTAQESKQLSLVVEDVDFTLRLCHMVVNINGQLASTPINRQVTISNGVFLPTSFESGMDVDNPADVERVVGGLNLTEDLWLVLERVYQ